MINVLDGVGRGGGDVERELGEDGGVGGVIGKCGDREHEGFEIEKENRPDLFFLLFFLMLFLDFFFCFFLFFRFFLSSQC